MYFNIFEILYSKLAKAVGKIFIIFLQTNCIQQGIFYEKAINIYKPHSKKIRWELCDPDADQLTHSGRCKRLELVMLKTKGQTFRYRFWNETKTLRYRFRICLIENRLFRFGPESALLDQIRNDLFRYEKFGKELKCFGFIPLR